MIRPTVFGYVQAHRTAQGFPRRPTTDRRDLLTFTEREGFTLDRIFVDMRDDGDQAALHALIAATASTTIVAVVVPDWSHLGDSAPNQDRTHNHITDTIGVPVLAARLISVQENP